MTTNPLPTFVLSPWQKLAAGRLYAARRAPYFTTALLALAPREAPGLDTMAVTHRAVLLWDPKAVERWSVQEVAAVLIHEVGHVLRHHHARGVACGADPKRFNLAGDAEINDDIAAMGLSLPGNPIMPKTLGQPDGLTAEEYYRSMPAPPPGGGVGSGLPDPNAPAAGGGWCGSAAGNAVPGEPADGDAAGRSEEDLARISAQTAEAIRQHQASNGQGSVPAGWSQWAEITMQKPRIPWQQRLARTVRAAASWRAGAVDYRYGKMSRRQGGLGFGKGKPVLPSLVAPVPRVMIAIDTSGSMGSQELGRAVSECQAILAAVGAEVDFVACDAAVHSDLKVRDIKQLVANVKGGGGTSFMPVFERLARKRPRPEVLVFVTDGCGDAPAHAPSGTRVIWLLVGPYRQHPVCDVGGKHGEVEWGEFIEVDDDQKTDTGED